MFRRLVSNLPFNPSLINQVGFYADRLRGETVVRRMSFVMMALVVAVQSLAVISPPERSLAASPNHILNGLTTKNDLLAAYDNPTSDIKDIFTRFSLSRADIAALPTNPNVTIRSNDGSDWWTTGRTSLWNYGKVADVYKRAEVPVQYRGENTTQTSDDAYIYARPLRAWDIVNPYNTYKAFQGKSSATGQDFWILLDCGNITWKGTWKTPPPPPPDTPPPPPPLPEPKVPALEIRKSIVNQPTSYKPGDSYTYKIEYRNKIIGSTAEDAYIRDQLAIKNFTVVSPRNLTITPTGYLNHAVGDLPGSSTFRVLEIKVQLKNPLASGTEVCNEASLVAKNASTAKLKLQSVPK